MTELPAGTVTLVFTDIEGSTRLLASLGSQYEAVLAGHRELLRASFASHHGVEVDTQGDAFFYAFARAHDALAGAIQSQRALVSHPWPVGAELRVRMGIHTGEPTVTPEGYVGADVHLGARICAVAWGEQILASDATARLVAQLPDASLRDLGEHSLKDIEGPVRLHQVVAPGLRHDFPPPRTASSHPTNLPPTLSPLVGRSEDITELVSLLASSDSRIVTITGPGGVGKTRVALAAGAKTLHSFDDGVFFVDLSALADPALVVGAIAAGLGLRESPGRTLTETLSDYLASRHTLLILDNLEHLLDAAADVSALVTSAPSLKILVTSREPLRIEGEREFPLPPLGLPVSGDEPEDILASPAVELFVARAQAVRPGFTVPREAAPYVARICRRVDGLPLAIELAAARVKVLSLAALASRLEESLAVLGSGRRDASDRQRTLQGAIAWSYGLLEDDEQRLFARLGVFAGGWTLEAAEAVCDRDDLSFDVLDGLSSLVDKSLVRQVEGDEDRFSMLETIREFASEKLEESGEAEEIRRAHAEYFARLVEYAEPRLVEAEQKQWLDRLETDYDNIRLFLQWALEHDGEVAVGAAGAIWRFWDVRGLITEGRSWLAQALQSADGPTRATAKALDGAAALAEVQGDYREAERLASQALDLHMRFGDESRVIEALTELAWIAQVEGRHDRAWLLCDQAVTMARRIEDTRRLARALRTWGGVASDKAETNRARELYEEALKLERALDNDRGVASTLLNLGELAINESDADRGRPLLEESLRIFRRIDDSYGVMAALTNLGLSALLEHSPQKAAASFRRALEHVHKLASVYGLVHCLEGLAAAAALLGNAGDTATLTAAARKIRDESRIPASPAELVLTERFVALARESLSEDAWSEATRRGQLMRSDEAIQHAMQHSG